MNWVYILTLLVPLFGAFGWLVRHMNKRFEQMEGRFDKMDWEFKELRRDVQSVDSRVARIEGHLFAPHDWKPQVKGEE